MSKKQRYYSDRIQFEKMKQKTWTWVVIAKFLSILDWMIHHWR